jgi:hypothetical protein
MNKLQPNEQILTGAWLVEDGRARGDAACERIEWLIAHHLQRIADSRSLALGRRSTEPPMMAAIGSERTRKARCTAVGRRS